MEQLDCDLEQVVLLAAHLDRLRHAVPPAHRRRVRPLRPRPVVVDEDALDTDWGNDTW